MSGIYIHIPFCRQKCHYCNFFSVASQKELPAVVKAICRETEIRQSYLNGSTVETIYLGGGTPSLVQPALLRLLLDTLRQYHAIDPQAEITLEANPDDITMEALESWKLAGINRLSIGVQSFRDQDLVYLNRVHHAGKALECLQMAGRAGFDNLTLDLIYGIPTLSDEGWKYNLQTAFDLDIPHISAYALTVEPKTALEAMIRKGKAAAVDEQCAARHFEVLLKSMTDHGYLHYEISNFCKPGHFARHNTAYWQGGTYLGLGPSAHSYNGESRQWNVAGIRGYLISVEGKTFPEGVEILTASQKYNEYVMTGLRTMWGCSAAEINRKFGYMFSAHFKNEVDPWVRKGYITQDGDQYVLTPEGKLLADGIAADLFAGDD